MYRDATASPMSVTLSGWLGPLIGILVILTIVAFVLLHFFYKGKVRQIVVVKKRTSLHELYDNNAAGKWRDTTTSVVPHLTIDFTYVGKKFVHTMNFYGEDFEKLEQNKTYSVRIRFNSIIKVYKEIENDDKR